MEMEKEKEKMENALKSHIEDAKNLKQQTEQDQKVIDKLESELAQLKEKVKELTDSIPVQMDVGTETSILLSQTPPLVPTPPNVSEDVVRLKAKNRELRAELLQMKKKLRAMEREKENGQRKKISGSSLFAMDSVELNLVDASFELDADETSLLEETDEPEDVTVEEVAKEEIQEEGKKEEGKEEEEEEVQNSQSDAGDEKREDEELPEQQLDPEQTATIQQLEDSLSFLEESDTIQKSRYDESQTELLDIDEDENEEKNEEKDRKQVNEREELGNQMEEAEAEMKEEPANDQEEGLHEKEAKEAKQEEQEEDIEYPFDEEKEENEISSIAEYQPECIRPALLDSTQDSIPFILSTSIVLPSGNVEDAFQSPSLRLVENERAKEKNEMNRQTSEQVTPHSLRLEESNTSLQMISPLSSSTPLVNHSARRLQQPSSHAKDNLPSSSSSSSSSISDAASISPWTSSPGISPLLYSTPPYEPGGMSYSPLVSPSYFGFGSTPSTASTNRSMGNPMNSADVPKGSPIETPTERASPPLSPPTLSSPLRSTIPTNVVGTPSPQTAKSSLPAGFQKAQSTQNSKTLTEGKTQRPKGTETKKSSSEVVKGANNSSSTRSSTTPSTVVVPSPSLQTHPSSSSFTSKLSQPKHFSKKASSKFGDSSNKKLTSSTSKLITPNASEKNLLKRSDSNSSVKQAQPIKSTHQLKRVPSDSLKPKQKSAAKPSSSIHTSSIGSSSAKKQDALPSKSIPAKPKTVAFAGIPTNPSSSSSSSSSSSHASSEIQPAKIPSLSLPQGIRQSRSLSRSQSRSPSRSRSNSCPRSHSRSCSRSHSPSPSPNDILPAVSVKRVESPSASSMKHHSTSTRSLSPSPSSGQLTQEDSQLPEEERSYCPKHQFHPSARLSPREQVGCTFKYCYCYQPPDEVGKGEGNEEGAEEQKRNNI
eukprot:MONOS_7583.1-p1 / transcript=MONOS_7583.1 / gene=MONOS_7583 / organism=Monocercomonoides_exilis_PA203 / gene_product=unspecified product / transcript_product=unspecified product / location=Mono_scaffold00262:60389-63193(-) / protein_length=935 / sequence_SO=supercontig / SO=protein_coding / is_pseudo=false